jgi:A/G-specific adenine glycosylase
MWSQLLTWSAREFGHLPWRQKRTLYRTLVSEIMLQQTTVATVLQHFERFLKRFPDLESLAGASEEEMLIAWKGLGYYRRAKNLKKIAEAIARDWHGDFPEHADDLQSITGIGPYTANALISIGMDRPALAVDANLERVLARLYGLTTVKGPRLQKQILQLFLENQIVPERHVSFRALNEALMDLGRTMCQANRVACEICPLKKQCKAHKEGKPLAYPMGAADKTIKKVVEFDLSLLRVVVKKGNKVLAYQKTAGEWLEGQWELPTFVIETNDMKFKQYPTLSKKIDLATLPMVKTGITKYSILNYILELSADEWKTWTLARETTWRDESADESNLSTASLKCLKKL